MNAIKQGEIADEDMRAVAEEIDQENAAKAPPEAPPAPVVPEPEPAKKEKAPEPQEPRETPPPPDVQRPVEGEEPWRKKQAEKQERRQQEADRYQKLEEQVGTLTQRLESVVTKDDLSEIKTLIANQASARTPSEKAEAKDDFETYIAELNPQSQEFARRIAEHVRKSTPQAPEIAPELTEELKFLKEERARREQEMAQMEARKQWEAHFENEFAAYVKAHPEYQNAKEDLRNLYFTPKYEKWDLAEIAEVNARTLVTPRKKTAESGGNVKSQELVLDLSTDDGKEKAARAVLDNWDNLDDKQLDEAVKALTTQSKKLIMNQNKVV